MNQVIEKEENKVSRIPGKAAIDPMQLIAEASARGASADELGKLVDLFERMQAKKAEQAFNDAKLEFQSKCPVIRKTKDGARNKNGYVISQYAPLEDIMVQIQPVLNECGLTVDYDQRVKDGIVKICCIVTHVEGHSKENFMTAASDYSGSKKGNDCQASAATTTYLKRYALCNALNIVVAGEDIDARLPPEMLTKSSSLNNLLETNKIVSSDAVLECKTLEELFALRPQIEVIQDPEVRDLLWDDFYMMKRQFEVDNEQGS